ncbi:MAG: HPF/RaiA family ribosome-associated protein [Deltaproteobacteria bacterium]|nr:HPF/RaiA family ribosome-associated protein [Deltaproteobacteria bacterium]
MEVPLELSFRDVERTQTVEDFIRRNVKKLEQTCDHIVSCRIAVEQPQKHQRRGSPYRVRIDLRVPPGHEVVVTRESSEGEIHDSLRKVLRDAFDAARRQVRGLSERQRGDVKSHPQVEQATGVVVRIFPEAGYGFLKTPDGEEVYFHRNSVLRGEFERMKAGTIVRFASEDGEEGLQASTVDVVELPPNRAEATTAVIDSPLGWR